MMPRCTLARNRPNHGHPGWHAAPLAGMLPHPMTQPKDLTPLLQGATAWVREVQQVLERAEVKAWTGPLPSG